MFSLALFTNQFPGRVCTFIARDIRALLDAGIDVTVFAIYPLDCRLWQFIPDDLPERMFPRTKVRHVRLLSAHTTLAAMRGILTGPSVEMAMDASRIMLSTLPWGLSVTAKTAYVLPKAWSWAGERHRSYDYILSYWGNYAATCAYVFHRAYQRDVPFGMFLHAGTDLYRDRPFLEQKLCYADHIFVVCEYNRGFLQQHYAGCYHHIHDKIVLHHLGIDLDVLSYSPGARDPTALLCVGGPSWRKGTMAALNVLRRLRATGRGVRLEVIGDSGEKERFRRTAAALGVADHVLFSGHRPFEYVRSAMCRASALLHLSPEIGDAVPTVIKEAMALGLPVVATRLAGIPELLDNGAAGMLTEPERAVEAADAVAKLLDDAFLRNQLALRARERAVAMFDMFRNGRRLAEIIRAGRRLGCSGV